jgi:hypothetical protein
MKPRKNTVLIFLLALLLTVFTAAMAQTAPQGDQKKTEACCSMPSCCCNGGSCGDSCEMKKHDTKNHGEKGGDCCKIKNKDKAKQKTAKA